MKSVLLCLALAVSAWGRYPDESALYEDLLVEDLYKRLSQLANSAIFDDMADADQGYNDQGYNAQGYNGQGYNAQDYNGQDYNAQPWMSDIALESRESGQADLRDHEYLEHSSIGDGFQYISGGAGEGKQHLTPNGNQDNTQEVKSDEVLPFYCHPPNPCPKGKTAEKDGCHEFVKDSAEAQQEWILKMQSRGMCACDEEHMFKCPSEEVSESESAGDYMEQNELDEVLDKLLGENEKMEDNPYMIKTAKREYIVPKKIRMRREANEIDRALDEMQAAKDKRNPYLDNAPKTHQVAKKG